MSKQTQNHKPTPSTAHLSIFLGNTSQLQIQSLEKIRNAAIDVIIQNRATDGSFYPATMDVVEQVYFEANNMMSQLLNEKFIN